MSERIELIQAGISGQASWNYSGGTKSGMIFDGSKFKGSSFYPSFWLSDNSILRDRSRAAYWDSMQARALLGRLCDNVIGEGLFLEPTPIWELLDGTSLTDKEKKIKSRDIVLRFHLWMKSRESDASEKLTGYELQYHNFLNEMRDGETIIIMRYSNDSNRMNPLSLQYIMPEQVKTPYSNSAIEAAKAKGNRIEDGIEINSFGKEIAIHIQDPVSLDFIRVPIYGPSGRRYVLHPMISDTLGSVRGTPILAPCIHELQKITDYSVAELEAAVGNAVFAAYIKPSQDKSSSRILDGIKKNSNTTESESNSNSESVKFDKPGLFVQRLGAGEDLVSFDTKRPNANFGDFVKVITKHISASLAVPIEILEESFNQNYSASRASLLLFWNKVIKDRAHIAAQFLNPIYEAWFTEEVRAKRIKANGFEDGSKLIKSAWLDCSWIGRSHPSIDPQREANASDIRIKAGLTTREREANIYNGSDFDDNVSKLKSENEALAEANASLPVDQGGSDPKNEQDQNQDQSNSQNNGGNNAN